MGLDLNPFDEGGLFGSGDAEDAKQKDAEAEALWEDLRRKSGAMAGSDQLDWGPNGDIRPYYAGDPLEAVRQQTLNAGPSRWFGTSSAYQDLGPSAYSDERLGPSAYETMGPSAYSELNFDPEASSEMGASRDYFADVMRDGTDDIAEAEYQRRAAEAEQNRKATTDAAMRDLEMRGQGAASDALLAELQGAQGAASDRYQAGLQANATAQARRDAAAGSRADVAERMGRGTLDADTARALGLDTYAANRAAGLDTYGVNQAAGLDAYDTTRAGGMDDYSGRSWDAQDAWKRGNMDDWYDVQDWNTGQQSDVNLANWNRNNSVNDSNTQSFNQNSAWNAGSEQRAFDNALSVTAGQTGQLGQSASGLREGAVYPFQDIALPAIAAAAKAAKEEEGA
jgi:hypothetical protein